MTDGAEAGPGDKTDERGDPTQPGDHSGLLDHWRPDSHDVFDATCGRIPALRAAETPVRARSLLTEVAGYHGVLMSKERVTPNPIVTWSGEPFCVTTADPPGSPPTLSHSPKTCVAHCGGHRQPASAPAPYERIPPL